MRKSILFAILFFAELLVLLFPSKSFGQCVDEDSVYAFTYKGRNYEFVNVITNRSRASDCAEERGGYLIDIESEDENIAIMSFLIDTLKNKYGIDLIDNDITKIRTGGRALYVHSNPTRIDWVWLNEPYNRTGNYLGKQIENRNGRDILDFSDTLFINWGLIDGKEKNYAYPTDYKTTFFGGTLALSLVVIEDNGSVLAEVGNWVNTPASTGMPFIIDYGCVDSIKTTWDTLHCSNKKLIINGKDITKPGIYNVKLKSYSECDSIVIYNVAFTDVDTNLLRYEERLVYGDNNADSYKWYRCDLDQQIEGEESSFLKITETGSYRLEAEKAGCTFISECYDYCIPVTTSIDTVKCSNESITINGEVYAERGFYTQKLNQVGFDCDSTLEIEIEDIYINTDIKKNGNELSAVQTDAAYQWYNCVGDVMIDGANSRTFSLTESGDYKVEITKDGCIEYSECFEYTDAASVKDINESDMFTVDYKNGTIAINNTMKYTQIELLDLNAKTIFKSNKLTHSIDISALPSGIYFIKLLSNSKVEMFKFMVSG